MVDLDRLERVLLHAARERRPVTYGTVLAYFGRKVTRITVGALCRDLGLVCERVEARGGPDLAVLVVRKSDGLPGEGYFTSLRADGIYDGPSTGPPAQALVAARQAAVYAAVADGASGWAEAVVGVEHGPTDDALGAENQDERQDGEDRDLAPLAADIGRP